MKRLMAATMVAGVVLVSAGTARAQLDDSVTILHGIPGITVDLVIDDEVVIAGFDAGDTQDFTPLAGMTLNDIEARRAGSDEVVIGPIDSFEVPGDGNNSVVIHLDEVGEPTITSFANESIPTDQGRGLLTVRHAAAAPQIAVLVDGQEVLSGIGNGTGDGVVLPAGEIVDAVVTVDGAPIASMPNLQLESNSQLIVYIGGNAADDDLEFYLQAVAGGEVSSVPTPSERQAQPDSDDETPPADDGVPAPDDGTPQPDVVNTGNSRILQGSITPSGAPFAAFIGIGLLAMAGVAFGVRRRLTPTS